MVQMHLFAKLAKSFITARASVYLLTSSPSLSIQGGWMTRCPLPQSPAHQGHSLTLLSFPSCPCLSALQQSVPFGTHTLSSSPSTKLRPFPLSAGHGDPTRGQQGELKERRPCHSDRWLEGLCHLVMQLSCPFQPNLCLILLVPRPSCEDCSSLCPLSDLADLTLCTS